MKDCHTCNRRLDRAIVIMGAGVARALVALAVMACQASQARGATFVTLDGLSPIMLPSGVSGNVVVGSYSDAPGLMHGYRYDCSNSSYAIIDFPGSTSTGIYDISGNTIGGWY